MEPICGAPGRQECGGQHGPKSAAGTARPEDLGMLTSYRQLSGAGLNSLPLAVTFPTLPSARCSRLHSVPDELLKILTPARGQGCCSLAERWHSPSTVHTPGPLSSTPPPRRPALSASSPLIHRKSPRGLRLRRGATPSVSDLNRQSSCGNNLICDFRQLPFPLCFWTMSWTYWLPKSLQALTLSEQKE